MANFKNCFERFLLLQVLQCASCSILNQALEENRSTSLGYNKQIKVLVSVGD